MTPNVGSVSLPPLPAPHPPPHCSPTMDEVNCSLYFLAHATLKNLLRSLVQGVSPSLQTGPRWSPQLARHKHGKRLREGSLDLQGDPDTVPRRKGAGLCYHQWWHCAGSASPLLGAKPPVNPSAAPQAGARPAGERKGAAWAPVAERLFLPDLDCC